jgi:hypothetical protein
MIRKTKQRAKARAELMHKKALSPCFRCSCLAVLEKVGNFPSSPSPWCFPAGLRRIFDQQETERTMATLFRTLSFTFLALVVCSSPLLADPWSITLVNDLDHNLTSEFKWTFDNFEFITNNPPTMHFRPGEGATYTPQNGLVNLGHGPVTRFPNDWHDHNSWANGANNISGAVIVATNSGSGQQDLGAFLNNFPPRPVLIPDPSLPGQELFTGVNLAQYLLDPLTTIPSSVEVVNGTSPDLPGFVIGLSPVSVDSSAGSYTTADPFTGTVGFTSELTLTSAVPEPAGVTLLGIGGIGLALAAWRNRRTRPGRT